MVKQMNLPYFTLFFPLSPNYTSDLKNKISKGCLAGSFGGVCDFWSRGCEFDPHVGCKDDFKNETLKKKKKTSNRADYSFNDVITLKLFFKKKIYLSISSFIYSAIYLKNASPVSKVSRRKIPLGVLVRVPASFSQSTGHGVA